jgi:hypothetical protein
MKRRDFLEQWGLSSLKIKLGFLEGEFARRDADRAAAWELYVELLTRVTTQYPSLVDGDEKAALDSTYEIFPLTREILRRQGSGCGEFAKLAIPVLNQTFDHSPQNGTAYCWPVRSKTRIAAPSSAPNYPDCNRIYATTDAPSRRWPKWRT